MLKRIKQYLSVKFFGFFVICDKSNNTEETIKNKEMIIDVYFSKKRCGGLR